MFFYPHVVSSCCFFLSFLHSIGSHGRQLGPIIVYYHHLFSITKADVLESRRPFYYLPKRSRRRSDSPSSRGMSIPLLSIIIIYTNYTKANFKEFRRPNDPIQTYIPMNRNSQGDINEHGSTIAKHRKAATIQGRRSGTKWETRISGQDTWHFRHAYGLRTKILYHGNDIRLHPFPLLPSSSPLL
jgi:hypothetical protein